MNVCSCFRKNTKIVPVEEPEHIVDLDFKLERKVSHGSIHSGSKEYNKIIEFRKTIDSDIIRRYIEPKYTNSGNDVLFFN